MEIDLSLAPMKLDERESEKIKKLRHHKLLATTFFVVMAFIFILMEYLLHTRHQAVWMGYVSAFSEAAMVGALADWFAVTALFHHPMGIKIPHTNLIEEKRQQIGDNLGGFVVENFLTPRAIRPYIRSVSIAGIAAKWLQQENNQKLLTVEAGKIATRILNNIDDRSAARFIADNGGKLLQQLDFNKILSGGIRYLLEKKEHQKIMEVLLHKAKFYIVNNEEIVRQRVKKESGFFVPGFVDNMLANRITVGLANYLDEIERNPRHPIREEVTEYLLQFAEKLGLGQQWQEEIGRLKQELLSEERLSQYAGDIWDSIKRKLRQDLEGENSSLLRFLERSLARISEYIRQDRQFRSKTDAWIRVKIYRLILHHRARVGELISRTVGNWRGNELSRKLELEVGKDLQFIRINGTLVGGLVGLVIYSISRLFIAL